MLLMARRVDKFDKLQLKHSTAVENILMVELFTEVTSSSIQMTNQSGFLLREEVRSWNVEDIDIPDSNGVRVQADKICVPVNNINTTCPLAPHLKMASPDMSPQY